MKYGTIPGVGLPVSRLVHGCVMLSTSKMDYVHQLLDDVMVTGCNAFDNAHIYGGGDCERALGDWIKSRGNRSEVVIITKGSHHSGDRRRVTPFDIASDLHDSLARLKTDYIDLYILHRDDPGVPVGPIVEALNEQMRAGRIRAFGGSNWTHTRIQEANDYAATHGLTPFVASSPHFSLAEQLCEPWDNCVTITGQAATDARAWYENNGMALLAWSSLAGGFLSGQYDRAAIEAYPPDASDIHVRCYRSPDNLERLDRASRLAKEKSVTIPQIALAYVFAQPMNTFALTAGRNKPEVLDNASALEISLTPGETAWLDLRQDTP